MKVAMVLGTRPEIIKMSPVIREFDKRGVEHFILHTGQHYSYNMDESFFDEIGLPKSRYNLGVRSKAPYLQGDHTGRMMTLVEELILKEKPDVVLVLGDTNTVLAASLCTAKFRTSRIGIELGHIEAGLRSFERTLPEEINRVVSDSLSDVLFAPTNTSKRNLLNESIAEHRIHVTGNTVTDALEFFRNKLSDKILTDLGVEKDNYFVLTAHREYNVDVPERFKAIADGVQKIHDEFGMKVIYPIHPRAKKMMATLGIKIPDCVKTIDPVGYLDFLSLQKNAKLALTDSGGVQEESCILGTPCVTLRDSTERPETVDLGCNVVSGLDPVNILNAATTVINAKDWKHPYGDGDAAVKIAKILAEKYEK